MIRSGAHTLFGTVTLTRPLADAIDAWHGAHPARDEFDARDRAWWIEAITLVEGNELTVYEETRSSYGQVDHTRSVIDAIAAIADTGDIELQHTDNGVHVFRWTVRH